LVGSWIIIEKKKAHLPDIGTYELLFPNMRIVATTEVDLAAEITRAEITSEVTDSEIRQESGQAEVLSSKTDLITEEKMEENGNELIEEPSQITSKEEEIIAQNTKPISQEKPQKKQINMKRSLMLLGGIIIAAAFLGYLLMREREPNA
jgi:hypothetical protein